jgi:hypothetical protein
VCSFNCRAQAPPPAHPPTFLLFFVVNPFSFPPGPISRAVSDDEVARGLLVSDGLAIKAHTAVLKWIEGERDSKVDSKATPAAAAAATQVPDVALSSALSVYANLCFEKKFKTRLQTLRPDVSEALLRYVR